MKNRWLILSLWFSLAACLSGYSAQFEVTGAVMQLRPETGSVVVAHDDIPGFMPAMTMPFKARDSEELKNLKVGDRIQFVFEVGEAESFAFNFKVAGKISQAVGPRLISREVEKVREGDRVPAASLVNQDGRPIELVDSDGRWTVMTFIFVRCPVPEYCPLMSRNFVSVQNGLSSEVQNEIRLLSITLDPAFDTPERLKSYGSSYGADFSNWDFASGDEEEINMLTEAFRVYVKENGVTLDHTLCTALISPEGVVHKIWRGNFWKPIEVISAIEEAIDGSSKS